MDTYAWTLKNSLTLWVHDSGGLTVEDSLWRT